MPTHPTPIAAPPHPTQPLIVLLTRTATDLSEDQFGLLAEQATRRGWRLLDMGLTGYSLSLDQVPAGAIVTELPSHPLVLQMLAMGLAVVRIGRLKHPDDGAVTVVLPDWVQAGGVAADHFMERGFSHLALFGHESMDIVPLIELGFSKQASAKGCVHHRFMIKAQDPSSPEPWDRQHLHDEMVRWLESLPKPVGILASSSFYAGTLSLVCVQQKLSMPEDVALMSVDNHQRICETASVPISAVSISQRHMMHTAIDLLSRRIKGHSVAKHTLIAADGVITRRSTDILAVDHPVVARTIRYMWDRLDQSYLSVDEIAAAMQTPRSTLERYFREHFQRGIHAELRRARLKRFAELLRTTDLPVRTLAPLVGFNSAKFLHNSFCKTYGETPRQYRLRASRSAKSLEP